ncbi:IS66 family transposase [Acidiphilium sp. AL]|uniref:IS66 family transposase n=1 Tax=Acidiphilium sp. AL TaxID=2871704 RepID=UPI0021CB6FAC|nr:IS66 family transposase [Acidiphilium sp. AL]MCU4161634.1 IS66 family transposase [Acidiphilium sp. AL]
MSLASAALPADLDALRAFALACQQELAAASSELQAAKFGLRLRVLEIEKLKVQIARLRRMAFGRSSERLDRQIGQLELQLEELETGAAEAAGDEVAEPAVDETPAPIKRSAKPKRAPLPDHLPREMIVHEPAHGAACTCTACGAAMAKLGEDATEVLDYIPGRFQVIRHVRPKYACKRCDEIAQAPVPNLPIPRGRATPSLLAMIVVSKYLVHLPLYRQSEIYAREGVDLPRSTLADYVGQAAWFLAPIAEGIRAHVFAAEKIHGDDTPVAVLAPGLGRTRTGRLWTFVRDDRPFRGTAPPAAAYFFSPDRKAEHPAGYLHGFNGFLQADAYAGFAALYDPDRKDPGPITEVGCWAHCRRKLFDVWEATKSPVAREAIDRIAAFYEIEANARFTPPDERLARRAALPELLDGFFAWAEATERKLSAKSALAEAFRYAITRRAALTRFATDARLEADNNIAENAIRGIALGRRNWLFAGSDEGGHRAATIITILQTAKLNGLNPQAYLTDTLTRIADGHPINRIDELMPWAIAARA